MMKHRWLVLFLVLSILAGGCAPIKQPVAPPLAPAAATAPASTPTAPSAAPAAAATAAAATAAPTNAAAPVTGATVAPAGQPASGVAPAQAGTPSTATAIKQWQDADVLAVDPNVREGKLANGLHYVIRQNGQPKNRAELRLVINAGSVLEEQDQRGLAHFLEHMLFRGTKRFPQQDLVNYLERIGMQFGPDINAYTSFDETVYELRIPLDDEQVLQTGLDVLVDWAGSATIDQTSVDAERGVIVEEHRLRDLNATGRLQDKIFPALLSGSRYAERLPIGDMSVVQKASAEDIRRFYQTWYRPDLMSVIAVGDFDAAHVEDLVRGKFAVLQDPASPQPRPSYEVPDFSGTHYVVATDPEATDTSVELYIRQPAHEGTTAGEYRDSLRRILFYQMLNARYLEISRGSGAPFVGAIAGSDTLVRTAEANIMAAQVQEEDITPGLDRLLLEVERARRYGFTQPELDRAKANVLERYRQFYNQKDTTDSSDLVDEYVRHVLTGEPIPGIAAEYALVQQYLPAIALDDANREVQRLTGTDNRLIVVAAPEKKGFTPPTEDDLARVAASVATQQIQPYAETAVAGQLMTTIPQPAAIISETTRADLGVTDLKLANGVRLLLKPTDFTQDEVMFTGIGPGGSSLVEDQDYAAARLISGIVSESGVGNFNRTDLDRILAGKSVSVNPSIDELSQSIDGMAAPADLETALQLVYLYVTQPRVDPDAVTSIKAAARAFLANRDLSPDAAMQDALSDLSTGGSIRGKSVLPLSEIENVNVDRGLAIYKERFANMGQFTFVFVGKFDPAQVKALAQKYLGTLPATGEADRWQDRLPVPVTGVQEKDVYAGKDPRATAQIVYHGAVEVTPENEVRLGLLSRIMDIDLRVVLREEMSGTYAPGVGESVRRLPKPQYRVAINFTADPARMKDLIAATFVQVDQLRNQGPTADDLTKAKEQEKRVYEEGLRTNSFWMSILTSYAFDPQDEDPTVPLRASDIIDKMTAQDIQQAAQEYLKQDQYIQVVLYPESAKPSGGQQAAAPAEPVAMTK